MAHALQDLADSLSGAGDPERAMECRREALDILLDPTMLPAFELELVSQDPVVGEFAGGYLHRLAEQIARHLQRSGRAAEAVSTVRNVLAYLEKTCPRGPLPAWTLDLLGQVEHQSGQLDAALVTYLRVWRLLVSWAPTKDDDSGAALDWDELDDSGRGGPELVRRVAQMLCVLLQENDRSVEVAMVCEQVEAIATAYKP